MTIDHPKSLTWFAIATSRCVVARAVACSVVVGALLTFINHGDCIATGCFTWNCCWKSLLTLLVPYGVSTVSSVQAVRHMQQPPEVEIAESQRHTEHDADG